jgi:queuine tRNA-ribosyltransferase
MPGPIIVLAPRRTPAVIPPNGSSNSAISIFTSTGFQLLSNQSYLSFIHNLRPDIAISLADLTYGPSPGNKRIVKMGDRTEEWLSELLENRQGRAVFAPVLPIDFHDQSEYINRLADEQASEIAGLAFYDSNLLLDIPATTSLARLPRLSLDEPASPHHIIRQISLGMDVFTSPFLGLATDAGIALTFRFPCPIQEDTTILNGGGHSIVPLGIDMWASKHSTSLLPLSASCSCYTCTSHHRAFIQHLLSAKEMLGWVLLQIHNHHILSTFFSDIRSSLQNGTFASDAEKFAKVYESQLPEKTGKGPRVRGYQFKSDGPGEGKKNEAAWGNLGGDDQIDGALIPDDNANGLEGKGFAEKAN